MHDSDLLAGLAVERAGPAGARDRAFGQLVPVIRVGPRFKFGAADSSFHADPLGDPRAVVGIRVLVQDPSLLL